MKKRILILTLLSSLVLVTGMATTENIYREVPDKAYIDNVHYDEKLKVIVVNVHVKAWFINVDEAYGIRVKNDVDIEKRIKQIMGEKPEIIRLQIIK